MTIYNVTTHKCIAGLHVDGVRRNGRRIDIGRHGERIPIEVAQYLEVFDWPQFNETGQIVPRRYPKFSDPDAYREHSNAVDAATADDVLLRVMRRGGKIFWTLKLDEPRKPRKPVADSVKRRCAKNARIAAFGVGDDTLPHGSESNKNSNIYLNYTNTGCTFSPSLPGDATYDVGLEYPFTLAEARGAVQSCNEYAEEYWQDSCGCEDCGVGTGEYGGYILNLDCKTCGGDGID